METKKISLVVPVYKKEDIIQECISVQLSVLASVASKKGMDYELIAVVDGKLDQSETKLKEIQNSHLRIISYEVNRGKGFAVRFGMMQSTGDLVGFVDAGLDLNPAVIEKMVDAIDVKNGIHIAVGSKKHPDSKLIYPLKRRIFSLGYSVLVRLSTGIFYQDTQVGAKLFSKELLEKVLPRILVKRFAFDVELLAVAHYLGYKKHADVPVEIDFTVDFSDSANLRQIFNMAWDTIAVGYRLRVLDYYRDSNKSKWSDSLYDLLNSKVTRIL